MGTFLSTPNKEKSSFDAEHNGKKYAACAMQGWRRGMEDAHIATFLNENLGAFAVFDGHCGPEVSKFCQNHFLEELEKSAKFQAGDLGGALTETFLQMDRLLSSPQYRTELETYKKLAQAENNNNTTTSNDNDNEDDDTPPGSKSPTKSSPTAQKYRRSEPPPSDLHHNDDDDDDDDDGNGGSSSHLVLQHSMPAIDTPSDEAEQVDDKKKKRRSMFSLLGQRSKSNISEQTNLDDSPPHFSNQDRVFSHPPALRKSKDDSSSPSKQIPTQTAVEIIKMLMEMKQGKQPNTSGEPNRICTLPDHAVRAGCTAAVALVTNSHIITANAGDSRIILSRGGEAIPLSEDHKPTQEREKNRIEAAGGFVVSANGQSRVNGNLNLSRAIGDLKYKQNTALPPEAQIITCAPDIRVEARTPQDEFLVVACDGVWDCMTNQQVVDYFHNKRKSSPGKLLSEIAGELFDEILATDPVSAKGIGSDNMTCVVTELN